MLSINSRLEKQQTQLYLYRGSLVPSAINEILISSDWLMHFWRESESISNLKIHHVERPRSSYSELFYWLKKQ